MTPSLNLKNIRFFILILFANLVMYLAILGNVQVFKSVVGFAYLLFIPGIVILKLFRLRNLETSEKILLSVALSIAFLMLIGLLLDLIAPLMGFTFPLSTNLLVITISITLLPLSLISKDDIDNDTFRIDIKNTKSLFLVTILILLFILGIYGIQALNASGNNIFLLLLILSMSTIICVASLSERVVPSRFYPLILIVFCISLLLFIEFDSALVTNYLIGNGDQWIEFYAFKSTDIISRWVSTIAASTNTPSLLPTYSMLSVTILPTIFERITGLDDSWLFKLLYPLVVCFMALGTYALYRTQTEKKVAFLATLFFITVSVGKGWGSDKQQIAQIFFVMLLLLIFKKGMPPIKKDILFVIFSAALVISHYALAYIFMLILLCTWLFSLLMNYLENSSFSINPARARSKISFDLVLIYLTIAFSWNTYVNFGEAFNLLSQTATTVVSNLSQFFDVQSRGSALTGLGIVQNPTILNSISTYLFIFTEFLLVLGFIWIVIKKSKSSFALEYKVIAALNLAIISVNLLLPRLADTFLMERFYQTTLITLAPLAVIGGKTILEHIPKIRPKFHFAILAFLIFVPLFMFQTGFIYEIAGVQNDSLPLDMHRWDNLKLYSVVVDSREVSGAVWISEHTNISNISMLSDAITRGNVLTAYALMGRGQISFLSNETSSALGINQFIFLSSMNIIDGRIIRPDYDFNSSQIFSVFENQNKIYSTGDCEVYKGIVP